MSVRLDELLRFVTAPIRDELDDISGREGRIAEQVRENFAQLERFRALNMAKLRDEFTINSLRQQAAKLRESLGGLSDEDQARIDAKPAYDTADERARQVARALEQGRTEVDVAIAALRRLRTGLPETPASVASGDATDLSKLAEEAGNLLAAAEAKAEAAAEELRVGTAEGSPVHRLRESWSRSYGEFATDYSAAAERSDAHRSSLEELDSLESRERELRSVVAKQIEELAALGDPLGQHRELRENWRQVQAERAAVVRQQCENLTTLSDGLIQGGIDEGSGAAQLLSHLKTAVAGAGVQTAKLEKLLARVGEAEEAVAAWHDTLDEIEVRILQEDRSATAPPKSALAILTDAEIERIAGRLAARTVMELGLVPLDDNPRFRYRAKEAEYINFEDASAGQQATALLKVLLSQEGPPLVIDQPEDDLDSKVVQDVVEHVWTAKKRRQLVLSSHNANLVVNGDAELVICCDYRTAGDHSGGRIKFVGAIDVPDGREEITAVMEGGEKAFRLRKEKYGF